MQARWIKSPLWDLTFIAFPWLPFYVLLLLTLENRVSIVSGSFSAILWTLIFGLQFTHRQYSYLLAYGDESIFRRYPRGFLLAPVILLAGVSLFYLLSTPPAVQAVILGLILLWEEWHVIMQRLGMLRIYAAKASGGFEGRTSSLLDRALIWTLVLGTVVLCYFYQRQNAMAHEAGRVIYSLVDPVFRRFPRLIVGAIALLSAGMGATWLRFEMRSSLPLARKVPRLLFVLSTIALLAIFPLSGPFVGFLVFTASHAIEYLAFVHLFERRKLARLETPRGLAVPLFRNPEWSVPALLSVHLVFYFYFLEGRLETSGVLIYSGVTGLLHFLYDGWIWKVRNPELRGNLEIASSRPSLESS